MPLHTFRPENVFLTKLSLFTPLNNPPSIPVFLYSTILAPSSPLVTDTHLPSLQDTTSLLTPDTYNL